MKIKDELASALVLSRNQYSLRWVFVVAFGVLVPLLVGLIRNEAAFSIFGSLTGYMLGLSTESGPLLHRFKVSLMTFVGIVIGFTLGLVFQDSVAIYFILGASIVYTLGVIAGKGAEVECALVFSAVSFYVARYANLHYEVDFSGILFYMTLALAAVIAANVISFLFFPLAEVEPHVRLRSSFYQVKTLDRIRHFYALTYMSAVLLSMLLVEWLNIDRGYWMVITVLLMMKPTRRESFHRVIQRVVGTISGVVIGLPLVELHLSVVVYAIFAVLFSALIPRVWKVNYWLVSMCVTVFVICLLEIATQGHLNAMVTMARIRATLYGCGISIFVIFLFQILASVKFRK